MRRAASRRTAELAGVKSRSPVRNRFLALGREQPPEGIALYTRALSRIETWMGAVVFLQNVMRRFVVNLFNDV